MTDELSFLKCRIDDIVSSVKLDGKPKILGFLSENEIAFAKLLLRNDTGYTFFGGFENAERQMLAVYPKDLELSNNAFPITPIRFTYIKNAGLTHRDFLGAFMSLKIERKTVGDISVFDGVCYTVATKEAAKLILSEVNKVKNVGVKSQICEFADLQKPENTKIQLRFTVTSNRLDAVVSSITHLSRERAKDLIISGEVFVNSLEVNKYVKPLTGGDKITIRGYGKYAVENCDEISKKGKIIFNISKYI